jgi:uncharacterized protein YdhG (YjbR/CyaY superfamily)
MVATSTMTMNAPAADGTGSEGVPMTAAEIDAYLDQLEEPKRSTLGQLRRDILAVVPDAQQCISYGVPGFKVGGKTIAGFAAFKHHLSYLPHSGSVFPEIADLLGGYQKSSGALRSRSMSRCRPIWYADSSKSGSRRPASRPRVDSR